MSRTVIAAVAMGLVVLGGCTSSAEPAPPPTSEGALTTTAPDDVAATSEPEPTTPEPEAGPPPMPEEANEKTEAGAEAFVEYWVGRLNWAYKTGDTAGLMEYASDQCKSCQGLVEAVPKSGLGEDYMRAKSVKGLLLGESGASVTTQVDVLSGEGKGLGEIVFELSDGHPWTVESITLVSDPS